MKRLFPAIICALALHAIILSADFNWLKLGPRPAPASRSLSITLATHKLQKRNAQAAITDNAPAKRLHPHFQQMPKEKAADTSATAPVDNASQIQKQSPAESPQKHRQKKNLKALTRKIKPVKARETTRAESINKDDVSSAAHAVIFSSVSSANQLSHDRLPAKTTFIHKTHRRSDEYMESTSSAATLISRKSNNSASATALIMAKPLYRQNPAPAYPRKARRLGYEGIVMLKVLVDENGRVDDLLVLESSGHPILDRTALASVKKWLFEPGTEGGIKKKMWVRVPIRFDLK
ncbi:MAG: energy transducer TonB [Desulfobacterales bacterium]